MADGGQRRKVRLLRPDITEPIEQTGPRRNRPALDRRGDWGEKGLRQEVPGEDLRFQIEVAGILIILGAGVPLLFQRLQLAQRRSPSLQKLIEIPSP